CPLALEASCPCCPPPAAPPSRPGGAGCTPQKIARGAGVPPPIACVTRSFSPPPPLSRPTRRIRSRCGRRQLWCCGPFYPPRLPVAACLRDNGSTQEQGGKGRDATPHHTTRDEHVSPHQESGEYEQ